MCFSGVSGLANHPAGWQTAAGNANYSAFPESRGQLHSGNMPK
jgi:hypothetical protein